MISCLLAVCADSVVIDRFSNGVSILNIIEQVKLERFPGVLPKIYSFFHLMREAGDPEQLDARVVFKMGDAEVLRTTMSISFQGKLRARSVVALQNFIVPAPGTLHVSLQVDGQSLGQWPIAFEALATQLPLNLQQQPPAQADSPTNVVPDP